MSCSQRRVLVLKDNTQRENMAEQDALFTPFYWASLCRCTGCCSVLYSVSRKENYIMRKSTWTLVDRNSTFFCNPLVHITVKSKDKKATITWGAHETLLLLPGRQCGSEEYSSSRISFMSTWFNLKVWNFLKMTQIKFTLLIMPSHLWTVSF